MSLEDRFRELVDRDAPPTPDELAALYDDAAPVDLDFMTGAWDGGTFSRDHPLEQYLHSIRWAGKTFRAPDDVDPIVCFADDGSRAANDVAGSAHLELNDYRGTKTATMVYDTQPMRDHFRRIDDATVIGAMEREGAEEPGFFYLTRS